MCLTMKADALDRKCSLTTSANLVHNLDSYLSMTLEAKPYSNIDPAISTMLAGCKGSCSKWQQSNKFEPTRLNMLALSCKANVLFDVLPFDTYRLPDDLRNNTTLI